MGPVSNVTAERANFVEGSRRGLPLNTGPAEVPYQRGFSSSVGSVSVNDVGLPVDQSAFQRQFLLEQMRMSSPTRFVVRVLASFVALPHSGQA